MSAVLPLLGGLLLGRFVNNRWVAIALQAVLFAIAAVVLIASAPSHGSSYGMGVLLAVILAPASVATFAMGTMWQHRTAAVNAA